MTTRLESSLLPPRASIVVRAVKAGEGARPAKVRPMTGRAKKPRECAFG